MNIRFFAATVLAAFSLVAPSLTPARGAQPAQPASSLHYQWTVGQTLRYLIQRDPYFAEPDKAVAAIGPDIPYQPPIVERLTETVRKISPSGIVTLALTLTAEPGFEDETHPQKPLKRLVTVTPSGRILTMTGGVLGNSPAEHDLLRGLPVLPTASHTTVGTSQAVWSHTLKPFLTERQSPDHDGTLVRTIYAGQFDRIIFDRQAGYLVRQDSTVAISSRLVMTGRGRRGVADFGRVVPHTQFIQTLTVERQADLP